MEIITSWTKKGMERVVLRLLRRRLGELPDNLEKRLDQMDTEQIDALADFLMDANSVEQIETWLSQTILS